MQRRSQRGFGTIETIFLCVVVAAVVSCGWWVWHSMQGKQADAPNYAPAAKTDDKQPSWKKYTNNTYGISYEYPDTWEVSSESYGKVSYSNIEQEFFGGLRRVRKDKPGITMEVGVLDQDLDTSVVWFENYYTRQPLLKVVKTDKQLKGKLSTQFLGPSTRRYLFSVGSKTYMFASVGEEENLELDRDYLTKFDKVFDSVRINKD